MGLDASSTLTTWMFADFVKTYGRQVFADIYSPGTCVVATSGKHEFRVRATGTDSAYAYHAETAGGAAIITIPSGATRYYLGARIKHAAGTSNTHSALYGLAAGNARIGFTRSAFGTGAGAAHFHVICTDGATPVVLSTIAEDTSYHIYEIYRDGSLVRSYVDGVAGGVTTNYTPSGDLQLALTLPASSTGDMYCDWVAVASLGAP